MRRQDEIRLLFPSQDSDTQKLLLSELEAYALSFDSDETFDVLRSALAHAVPRVRHQALASFTNFLPQYVARRMRAVEELAGLWTEYHNASARPDPAVLLAERAAREKVREHARAALVPLADAIAERLDTIPADQRLSPRLALGY